MNFQITLPEPLSRVVAERAAAAGKDPETFLEEIVTQEIGETEILDPVSVAVSSADISQKLRMLIHQHGIANGRCDDSRDSIYAGRGE